jgi:hypothetical protein
MYLYFPSFSGFLLYDDGEVTAMSIKSPQRFTFFGCFPLMRRACTSLARWLFGQKRQMGYGYISHPMS